MNQIEKRNDLNERDCIILEQINNNRNHIHFLKNETPFSYEQYLKYVSDMFIILLKLFAIEKNYGDNLK